jgi:hypothetical protein
MAITLVAQPPNVICNAATFNVTTDLVEDSTHVNLRIRCDITVAAVIVATVEKPKGLPDFDFGDILKSLIPGISFTRNSGDIVKVSGGSPLVAYTVLFTEVWENAGTTTTGDTESSYGTTFRYIHAKGDNITFDTYYILQGSDGRFANKTLRDNVCKFYTVNPLEYWIVFFTSVVHCELFYSKDGGAYDHATHFDPTDSWGVIIINKDELMSGVTSNLRIQLGEVGGAKISEVMTIYVDNTDIAERVVLEFDGLVGGKEYLAFEGLKNIEFTTIRNYYQSAKKNRKSVSLTGIGKQKVETRFKDIYNSEYLKSLMISDNVKKLELSYATPTDVTIVSDTVKISSSDMFTNQLDLEYEY